MLDRSRWTSRLGDPSLILAIIGTVIFYAIVFQPSMKGGVLYRYTTEHVVEYVIVAMFLWGMTDILLKLCGFPRELIAMRPHWIASRAGRERVTNAALS